MHTEVNKIISARLTFTFWSSVIVIARTSICVDSLRACPAVQTWIRFAPINRICKRNKKNIL